MNMVLRNKIKYVQMSRLENVSNYFMSITQVHDKVGLYRSHDCGIEWFSQVLGTIC
jgi:hypothetical protein